MVCLILPAFWGIASGCGGAGKPSFRDDGPTKAEARRTPSTDDPLASRKPDETSSVFNRRPERRLVEFKVHRISAPRGVFTAQEAIWKLVAGKLPSAAATMHLADNGFRAAVGLDAHRQALLAELQGLPDLRIAVDQVVPDIQRTIELEIGACGEHQIVFYLDRTGGLHGMDFVQAKARLRLMLEWRSVNPDELWLRLTPELEEPPGPMRWEMTPSGPQMAPERRSRTFEELSFDAAIPPGGFLLLGPTPAVYDRPLLARPFFVEEAAQAGTETAPESRENIYVISPILRIVTPEPQAPGSGATARGE